MASLPSSPRAQPPRRYKRNPQWRRDRRARPSMATLEAALAVIPNLPRPLLCRLTQRMIERLDRMNADPDQESGDEDEEHDGREEELAL